MPASFEIHHTQSLMFCKRSSLRDTRIKEKDLVEMYLKLPLYYLKTTKINKILKFIGQ